MRSVHLIRKPLLADLSVGRSCIDHASGGINVDASRIRFAVSDSMDESSVKHNKTPLYGGSSYFSSETLGFTDGNQAHGEGRWPANVILQHLGGCRVVGVIETEGYAINRWSDGAKPFGGGAGHRYDSTQTPKERQAVWECEPLCPVDDLNSVEENGARFFKQVKG